MFRHVLKPRLCGLSAQHSHIVLIFHLLSYTLILPVNSCASREHDKSQCFRYLTTSSSSLGQWIRSCRVVGSLVGFPGLRPCTEVDRGLSSQPCAVFCMAHNRSHSGHFDWLYWHVLTRAARWRGVCLAQKQCRRFWPPCLNQGHN